MIRRRAFLIASAISLILCVASAGLWVWGRTDDQHHLPIGNPIRLLSFGDGNPIRVLCFGDGKVICMVRSEASLESHPDLTSDTFIEAAGFEYWGQQIRCPHLECIGSAVVPRLSDCRAAGRLGVEEKADGAGPLPRVRV